MGSFSIGMPSGEQAAESSSHDPGFAELVRRIRIGDESAIQDLRSIFGAGVEFCLRRRLGKPDVSSEAAAVIRAAAESIRERRISSPADLPGLIVVTMRSHISSHAPAAAATATGSPAEGIAEEVIAEMSAVEQNILRQYYLLGESAENIRSRLGVSLEVIHSALATARSKFWRKSRKKQSASAPEGGVGANRPEER